MKANPIHKKEIAQLLHKLKTGQATDLDKQMLEEYWDNALSDTSTLEEMSIDSCERLKNEMFHAILVRLALKQENLQ